jgi:hypothetical protein
MYWTAAVGLCGSDVDAGVVTLVEMNGLFVAAGPEAGASAYGGVVLYGDDGGVLTSNDTDAGFVLSLCTGMVMKMSLDGGTPTVLASGQGFGIRNIAVDATNVYWAADPGTVSKVPKTGGPVTVLASGLGTIGDLQTDAANVYWIHGTPNKELAATGNYIDGDIMAISVEGGTPTTLVSGQTALAGLAVDGTNVYWTTGGTGPYCNMDGTIMKVSPRGGTPIILASGQPQPTDIAVDDTSVYWTNGAQWIKGAAWPDIGHLDTTIGAVIKRTPK